ncbi:hypothetical protein GCM10023080_026170 [Streptomyces pseudoechinosporeus]
MQPVPEAVPEPVSVPVPEVKHREARPVNTPETIRSLAVLGLDAVAEACRFTTQVAALTCSFAGPNPPCPNQLARFATSGDA